MVRPCVIDVSTEARSLNLSSAEAPEVIKTAKRADTASAILRMLAFPPIRLPARYRRARYNRPCGPPDRAGFRAQGLFANRVFTIELNPSTFQSRLSRAAAHRSGPAVSRGVGFRQGVRSAVFLQVVGRKCRRSSLIGGHRRGKAAATLPIERSAGGLFRRHREAAVFELRLQPAFSARDLAIACSLMWP